MLYSFPANTFSTKKKLSKINVIFHIDFTGFLFIFVKISSCSNFLQKKVTIHLRNSILLSSSSYLLIFLSNSKKILFWTKFIQQRTKSIHSLVFNMKTQMPKKQLQILHACEKHSHYLRLSAHHSARWGEEKIVIGKLHWIFRRKNSLK